MTTSALDENWAKDVSRYTVSCPGTVERARDYARRIWRRPWPRTVRKQVIALFCQALFGGRLVANHRHIFVVCRGEVIDLIGHVRAVRTLGDRAYQDDAYLLLDPDYRAGLAAGKERAARWIRRFESESVTPTAEPAD